MEYLWIIRKADKNSLKSACLYFGLPVGFKSDMQDSIKRYLDSYNWQFDYDMNMFRVVKKLLLSA